MKGKIENRKLFLKALTPEQNINLSTFYIISLKNCRRKYLEANEFLSRYHEHARYHYAFMVLNNFYILQKNIYILNTKIE